MYFTSKIEIDPSQITKIKRLKKDKMFSRLAKAMTHKSDDDKIELETFTVMSILSQIKNGLDKIGIDNIIRLSINGFDFYLDKEETENDLNLAISKLDDVIDPLESKRFEDVELVLEHSDEDFKYYISIKIERKHKVGKYPIKITSNGLIKNFQFEDDTESSILDKMSTDFQDQQSYDSMVSSLHHKFKKSNQELQAILSEFINVDGVRVKYHKNIVRPLIGDDKIPKINNNYKAEPVFHGYAGIKKYFDYNLYWMKLCSKKNIICNNFDLVDYNGNKSLKINNFPIDAGKSEIFNLENNLRESDISGIKIMPDSYLKSSKNSPHNSNEYDEDVYREFDYKNLDANKSLKS